MNFGDEQYTKAKERTKKIRVVLQIFILACLAGVLALALFTFKHYVPFQERDDITVGADRGFVALSYFGVARTSDADLIAESRLEEHLRAMKNSGYETVTQQDIIDYYLNGKPLPEKALYLAFEDGRRDTAIFAQKVLEKLNYKATAMTYPEKFELKDTKFLMPRELKDLIGTTYWEMGTNGYRLAFINVFDRYDNYLGELTPLKHSMVAGCLGRKYNHYLMDYMRDENFFPKESYSAMQDRISYDYEKLRDVYNAELGFVPKAYVLMHSNTGAFGNNPDVSAVNEKWITQLFAMNFNREGYSWNNRKSSIFDLTRMQPQSYWPANHVLMRVLHDNHMPVNFVRGDRKEAAKWEIKSGEPEFKTQRFVLTTEPQGKSLMMLKKLNAADVHAVVRMNGHRAGTQTLYLRGDEGLSNAIAISLAGNYLFVNDGSREVLKLDLNKFDGKERVSIEEDKRAAEVKELETFARYAATKEQAEIYVKRRNDRAEQPAKSVEEGAEEYVGNLSVKAQGDRKLEIYLRGKSLKIVLDHRMLDELQVNNVGSGKLALEASWTNKGWSQRNLADDVYDGVFEDLMVYDYSAGEAPEPLLSINVLGKKLEIPKLWGDAEPILYDSRPEGLDYVVFRAKRAWEKLLDFFINVF